MMRCAGSTPCAPHARGDRSAVAGRPGISDALALAESDRDRTTGGMVVRRGKGDKRREVGMDDWGWQETDPWLDRRGSLPVGALLRVIDGPTIGRPCHRRPSEPTCGGSPWSPACGAASRCTSSAMRTRRGGPRGRRAQTSSGVSSVTRTSARSISRASTTARSSTPSTPGRRPCCPLALAFADRPRQHVRSGSRHALSQRLPVVRWRAGTNAYPEHESAGELRNDHSSRRALHASGRDRTSLTSS
jgi:hypothetical protein